MKSNVDAIAAQSSNNGSNIDSVEKAIEAFNNRQYPIESPPPYFYSRYNGRSKLATKFLFFSDEYGNGQYMKRRGPRTTIKQQQLDVLNRIFGTTPKPSKHARAKLALETGLSMRVIQVWFQVRVFAS